MYFLRKQGSVLPVLGLLHPMNSPFRNKNRKKIQMILNNNILLTYDIEHTE